MDRSLYENIVKPRPYLWWWVKDKSSLSIESVVEGVLANGNIDDIKVLFQELGKEKVKDIFTRQILRPRHNYRPQTINFFKKVFSLDV